MNPNKIHRFIFYSPDRFEPIMASPLMSLVHDDDRYQKSFQLFLERSSEHQCMKDFIHNKLPHILASIGDGKSHLNVIEVGSGAGDIDLEMLSELHKKHPEVTIDNEVVEPSSQQLHHYQVLVSQKPELNYTKFTWNKMTASEFEENWKQKKMTKKADFVHMIQMLYYVKDLGATISFFQSLLDKNGKLIITLVSGWLGETVPEIQEPVVQHRNKLLCNHKRHQMLPGLQGSELPEL
ncbi:transcript variant X2 [Nothobranchius furzeri]|uniref:Transcript variant X2 n=1 Tax=Nothobranchius furzeri TaxID=105023 RepID=A0A9D2YA98_NOTFU|nr:transcript variant X2 [Nothobranchius furzeri]